MNKTNGYQKLLLAFFISVSLLWFGLFVTHTTEGKLNYLYSFLFGLVPLLGGVVGMVKSRGWGGLKSSMGKAIFWISLGLVLWGLGETIWSYYNFVKNVPAPYPSLADLGFAPSIFFWILGTWYLSVATGARFTIRKHKISRVVAIAVPLVLLIPTYLLQVKLARGGTIVPEGEALLKAILDIAYPFGDFLAVTFAAIVFVLSYKYFGGLYKRAFVALLGGLALMYFGDTIFAYTTTKETYYNGDWGDLLLSLGLFLMTFGILAFASKPAVRNPTDTLKEG